MPKPKTNHQLLKLIKKAYEKAANESCQGAKGGGCPFIDCLYHRHLDEARKHYKTLSQRYRWAYNLRKTK